MKMSTVNSSNYSSLIYLTFFIAATTAFFLLQHLLQSEKRHTFPPTTPKAENPSRTTTRGVYHIYRAGDQPHQNFPRTDFSHSLNKTGRDFWNSTKPSFHCTDKSRVGRKGDGGKWTCGLEALANRTIKSNYPCVVYSFGVNGESSFEAEVLQASHCRIYAYDMSTTKMGPEVKMNSPRVHFQSLGITESKNGTNLKTLKELMKSNGHTWIDILKIDVEGAEFDSLDRVFTDFEQLPFGQLLIELHGHSWEGRRKIINLLKGLEDRGMRIFNVELNIPGCCSEYSLINVHALKLFGQNS